MTLRAGSNLGHFEIIGLLGIGGMGEVYHARDLQLGREVAVKVLPERVAEDASLLQRFEREARALAALNHPHIASIYNLERDGATRFLVMELVGGQTLQDRLRSGPMPQDEVLLVFEQIAEALETAHEQGIIHRDLKPANIKVTDDDRVKVLDFGLAKVFEKAEVAPSSGGTVSLEPDSDLTAEGAIVGTIIYMSPEQARGRPVDKRTDIWAFGCMLYEALAGRPPYRGETGSDTLAHILEREPDWDLLPKDTPARIRELLWRCLQKDPKRRLRDIGEAWFGLREHQSSSVSAPFSPPPTRQSDRSFLRLGIMLAMAVVLGTGVGFLLFAPDAGVSTPAPKSALSQSGGAPESRIRRFSIDMAGPLMNSPVIPFFALSPDGSMLAYTIHEPDRSGLYLRPLDRYEERSFSGTEMVYAPFFSPSGDEIGMLRNHANSLQVLKVSTAGGSPIQVASTTAGPQSGQAWGENGMIVINPKVRSPLFAVPDSGGTLEPLTTIDEENGERMHLYPQVLPGGKAVMYTSVGSDENDMTFGGIDVMFLDTKERKTVLHDAAFGRYVASGHLLYTPISRDGAPEYVAGVAFDLEKMETVGKEGRPALRDVYIHPISYLAQFDVSNDGTLAYLPNVPRKTEVVWVDREGNVEPVGMPVREYTAPRLSPDGRKVAVAIDEGSHEDIWYYDLARDSLSRLTFMASAHSPVWHPDGNSLVVAAARDRFVNLYSVDGGGGGIQDLLTRSESFECPTNFSDDGSVLAWSTLDLRESSYNVAVGTPSREGVPAPYFDSPLWEMWPAISPDGNWVTFVSNRTGDAEVYVAPYPGPGSIVQVSNQGGTEPLWSHQGDEVFYRNGDAMMAASVDFSGSPRIGVPTKLFEGRFMAAEGGFAHAYDVTPDGRFLMVRGLDRPGELSSEIRRINIVLNWFEELNALIPPPQAGN